jgi:pSer/pThr/pTyr-binding forkhead associated (FHA) protein
MMPSVTLTVRAGEREGHTVTFRVPHTYLIGRAPDCDLVVPNEPWHRNVSRHHCVLEINPPEVWVRDVGSLNGTYVNGERLTPPPESGLESDPAGRALGPGDRVQVGSLVLEVSAVKPSARGSDGAAMEWEPMSNSRG